MRKLSLNKFILFIFFLCICSLLFSPVTWAQQFSNDNLPPRLARLSPAMMGSVPTGNDFSADTNCVALWKLDSITTTTPDSIGGNTLNNDGVASETTEKREGTGSGLWAIADTDSLYLADASLDADFPLKNGNTNLDFSVCAWVRFTSFGNGTVVRNILAKWDSDNDDRSFTLFGWLNGSSQKVLGIGIYTFTSEFVFHTENLSENVWYHATFSYDGSRNWAIRIRNTSGGVVGTDATGTTTLLIEATASPVTVGANSDATPQDFDGYIDEVVVFKDIITSDEATAIAKGLYK